MTFLDEPAWRGKVYQGGWTRGAGGDVAVIEPATVEDEANVPFGGVGASGTGKRFGGGANVESFTDTRWVTIRGDIAPYPF